MAAFAQIAFAAQKSHPTEEDVREKDAGTDESYPVSQVA
jgi:hypothetical protein